VAERLFALPYQSFPVEWDDVRTMGDYSTLRHVGDGLVVVLGIISTKDRRIESEDELLRHIDRASRYLDADQLALSPQCGFASEAAGNLIDEEQQWRKLDLVGRVADRVWPR
jgi:methionine synthase II (cobalamin-independent)